MSVEHVERLRVAWVDTDAVGKLMADSRAMDLPSERTLVLWSEPTPPHTLENVGDRVIHAIVIELKG